MAQVIARRYRPQTFEEVIGQEAIVRTLRNAVASGRIAHGYIFSGHRGIGKTTVARILAKALNCRAGTGPTPTPCGECESCREIREGNAVDVIEVDAASNRGIDEIRALRDRVRYRPARDRYKFFILDEAHQLTGDAFNALLKTLEEPPEWAVFVLATTEPEALPATIRSRCQHFGFRAVSYAAILEHLRGICAREGVEAEEEALGLIADAGEGSVRDALSLLDQALAHAAAESGGKLQAEAVRTLLGRVASGPLRELFGALAQGDSRMVLSQAATLLAAGVAPAALCGQLTRMARNGLIARTAPELLEGPESEQASATACAEWFGEEELTRFLQILLRCAADLRHGEQERFHLELALAKMLQARRLTSVEAVLAALETGGTSAGPPAAVKPAPAMPRPSAPATRASAPAAVAPAAAAPQPDATPTQAVRTALENQGRAALLSVTGKASWNWNGDELELAFAPADGAMAKLAQSAANRKALEEACRAALGRAVTLTIATREDAAGEAAPEAPAQLGSLEARAQQHPRLRELRERIPSHILRTREWEP